MVAVEQVQGALPAQVIFIISVIITVMVISVAIISIMFIAIESSASTAFAVLPDLQEEAIKKKLATT